MATFCDGIVQNIERTECIGNSLTKINSNFSGLETAGCELESEIVALNTEVGQLSSITEQVKPTVLFVPVNFATRSNQNVVAIPGTGNIVYGTTPNTLKTFTGNTSTNPWWSGVQTANLSGAPVNAVAASVNIWFNVNAYGNNGQTLLIRKDSSENWNSPQDQGGPASGNITVTQRNNINYSFYKIGIDPNPPEGEAYVTIPVYFNTTSKTFQWFIIDAKDGAPTATPEYNVRMTVLGYYLQVV